MVVNNNYVLQFKDDFDFIIFYFFVTFFVVFLLLFLNTLLSPKVKLEKKLTPYECGFSPFSSPSETVNIQFYRICLIFLIFDVELVAILP